MKWLREMYTGEKLAGDLPSILHRIDEENGEMTDLCRLITLSTAQQCQLDILPVKEITKPFYRQADLAVVGIAADRKEAQTVVTRMLEDCMKAGKGGQLRTYFEAMGEDAFGSREEVSVRQS